MILITGLGRSGTSFVAECFNELGYNPGGRFRESINAGWEHPPVHVLCRELLAGPLKVRFPTCQQSEELLDKPISETNPLPLRTRLQESFLNQKTGEMMKVIKSPFLLPLLDLWIHAGLVDSVVQPSRTLAQIARSRKVWDVGIIPYVYGEEDVDLVMLAAIGHGSQVCTYHRVPLCTFQFPEVLIQGTADNTIFADELVRLVGKSLSEVRDVIQKVSRPETMRVGS